MIIALFPGRWWAYAIEAMGIVQQKDDYTPHWTRP